VRACISLAVITVVAAGALGEAAAQSYPSAPPGDFYPEPPMQYPGSMPRPYAEVPPPAGGEATEPPSGYYGRAPYVYRDANGVPLSPYGPAHDEGASGPPPAPPYFAPDIRMPPQPLPSLSGAPVTRPPADVAGAAAGEVTGSVYGADRNAPEPDRGAVIAALPQEERPEQGPPRPLPRQFRRQLVDYPTTEPAGTIIIDTPHTYLYLVRGDGKAVRYGVGVGREGFTWSGTERISRTSEWPDWHPPKEMIERQPYLPRFMAGGEGNPLGARALYLGNTVYRIHGTNQPSTIGSFVSSGCIRLTNEDIEDLYSRVSVGTRVVVLPGSPPASTASVHRTIAR
jgi:lipoprotein-anchoring transpeptidase ErfK/SrfK